MYNDHASLLMERFPKLGLLAATWEPIPSSTETPPLVHLGDAKILYVYGLGDGTAYRKFKDWLHEDKKRGLVFLEDEPGYIATFLENEIASELLSDEQVHLELISKGRRRTKELEAICEKFPARKIEVIAQPSRTGRELGRRYQAIRLSLLRKTTLAHGLHFDRLHGYQPFHNFVKSLKILPQSFYANKMKNKFAKIPAIVCGAGPSLESALPLLREYEDQVLMIAGGSTLAALSSQGIIPHFGMAIDPNVEEYHRFKNTFTFEMPLLYCTRVFPPIFQTCNGPFVYMRTGIGGMTELWMDEQLGLKGEMLGDHLTAETMSVTAISLAWAQFLGCDPIFLSGVDLAYTREKRYAPGVAEEQPFDQIQATKAASDQIYKRKDRSGKSVYTAVRWVMESACMSHFAKKHLETRFINTTEGGIGFKHIPFQPLQEVLPLYCNRKLNLRRSVQEKLFASPMPARTGKIISEKMKELKESLDRVIEHLEVLWKEKSEGKRALAELELQDEMAYSYLFYDAEMLFGEEENKWELFYKQACRYAQVF